MFFLLRQFQGHWLEVITKQATHHIWRVRALSSNGSAVEGAKENPAARMEGAAAEESDGEENEAIGEWTSQWCFESKSSDSSSDYLRYILSRNEILRCSNSSQMSSLRGKFYMHEQTLASCDNGWASVSKRASIRTDHAMRPR